MPEIPGVSAKIGADVSDYVSAMVTASESTKKLADASEFTTAQLVELWKATGAQRDKLIELWRASNDAGEGTKRWTDAQQQAAMASAALYQEATRVNDAMDRQHLAALKLNEALDEGKTHTSHLGEEMLKIVGLGAALGGGIEIATKAMEFLKEATIGSIEEFVKFGHDLDILHEKIGVPVEIAAAWEQSASYTGIAAERIANSLAMMDQRLEENNKRALEAVNKLGISFVELRDAAPERQMEMLTQALERFTASGGKADVVIKELMGRGGLGMLPALTQEAADLRRRIEEIQGPLEEQVATSQKYELSAALLEAHWSAIKRSMTEPIVGGLAALMEAMYKNPGQFVGMFAGMVGPGGMMMPPVPGGGDHPGDISLPYHPITEDTVIVDVTKREAEAKRELALYTQQLNELEKEDAIALAGETTGLNAQIEKIHAVIDAKIQKIMTEEEEDKLSHAHADTLISEAEALGRDQEASARAREESKLRTEATLNEYKEKEGEAKRWQEIDHQVAEQVIADVRQTTAFQEEAARANLSADAAMAKANEDLSKAFHQKGDAIEFATQRTVDAIAKTRDHYLESHHLSDEERALTEAKFAVAIATEMEAGAEARHVEHLKEVARGLKVAAGFTNEFASALQAMGIIAAESYQRVVTGTHQALSGVEELIQAYATGNYALAFKGGFDIVTGIKNIFNKPESQQIQEAIGHEMGIHISDALAKSMEDTDVRFNVGQYLSELMNIDALMKEGITIGMDPGHFLNPIMDMMNAVSEGLVPVRLGITELGKAFTELEKAAKAGSVASEIAMIQMIEKARQLHEVIPEIQAFVLSTLQGGVGGLADFFSGQSGAPTGPKGHRGPTEWSSEQGGANAQILGANFSALAAQEGVVKAAEDLQKAFDELMSHMPKDMAMPKQLEHLAMMEDLLRDANFKKAAQASEAGAQNLHALLDTGYLNQQTLDAFSTINTGLMHQQIQTAIDHGYSPDQARIAGEEANLPMLTQLQHAEALGMRLSPEAKEMLAQAQKDGILPVATLAEQQLGVLKEIRDKIGGGHDSGGGGLYGYNFDGTPDNDGDKTNSYEIGGPVLSTGMALVHQGEYVLPRGSNSAMGSEAVAEMRGLRADINALFRMLPDQIRDAGLLR